MKGKNLILIYLFTLLVSCSINEGSHEKDQQLRDNICGDWEKITEKKDYLDNIPNLPFFFQQGMTISLDSIEFYLGFFKSEIDSLTGRRTQQYMGNMVPYKTHQDSIICKNPITEKWEYKWKFLSRTKDTLKLAINDTIIFSYKKLHYNIDTLPDFDQIIYSSSGCYGSCPIIDISIDKKGNVLFQGEGFVKPLGFYSSMVNDKTQKYIFNKFRKANPLRLSDEYAVGHTDDESITTTYIKNGKIIKTIDDYGAASTNALIWAYVPIANIHNSIQLDSLPIDDPFYPKLQYFTFKKDKLTLSLKKSESFYLWTELKKAKQTTESFKSKYKMDFMRNYTYWGPDPNKARKHKYEIKALTTDGRYFKFEFIGENPITYDLGYNFIETNFKSSDFKKPNELEY